MLFSDELDILMIYTLFVQIFQAKKNACAIFLRFFATPKSVLLDSSSDLRVPWPCGSLSSSSPLCFSSTLQPAVAATTTTPVNATGLDATVTLSTGGAKKTTMRSNMVVTFQ